jgi:hypothetical protein
MCPDRPPAPDPPLATVKARILSHIAQHESRVGEYDAPYELTQSGISETLGLGRNHISQEITHLLRRERVVCMVRHVPGHIKRMRVYVRMDCRAAREYPAHYSERHLADKMVLAEARLRRIEERLDAISANKYKEQNKNSQKGC